MAMAVLPGIIAMLAIYAGAVIVAMQHIAERHSPSLIPIIVRRSVLVALVLVALLPTVGALALVPSRPVWEGISLGLLLVAVIIAIWRSAAVWADVSDGAAVVAWLRRAPETYRVVTLQEMFWNAVGRADRRVIVAVLDAVRTGDQKTKMAFLAWLGDHSEVVSSEWLTSDVLEHLVVDGIHALRELEPLRDISQARVVDEGELPGGGTLQRLELPPINPDYPHVRASQQQETYNDCLTALILRLFADALNVEAFGRAAQIIKQMGSALGDAAPWTQAHAELLYRLGYAVWNVGEPGASIPRTARIPAQLGEIEGWYSKALRGVWARLQTVGNPDEIETYASLLGGVAGEVSLEGLSNFILPRIYDVLEDGFTQHLLTNHTIEQLAADLGLARHVAGDDKRTQQRIDDYIITLATMRVELGGDMAAVSHLLGNGHITVRRGTGETYHYDWLKPESYAVVTRLLK